MTDLGLAEPRRARLYGHVLLEGLSGPWAPAIELALGPSFLEICRVLYDRQKIRLTCEPVDLSADEVDWAAIRALAPLMLQLYDEEFHATTGHDLAELRALGQAALDRRREYRAPHHGISYAIGECEVALPTGYLEDRSLVAAAPDERSWNTVMPDCARDRRDEFLVPLRKKFVEGGANRSWIELPVASMDGLRSWIDARRRRKPPPLAEPELPE